MYHIPILQPLHMLYYNVILTNKINDFCQAFVAYCHTFLPYLTSSLFSAITSLMTTQQDALLIHKKYPPGRHPNSIKAGTANLIPYKPGQNGHGRVYSLANRLKHALDKPLAIPEKNATAGEQIVYKTLAGAIDLVPVAFREVWDRTEGKVPGDTPPIQNINVIFVIGKGYQSQVPTIEGAGQVIEME